MKKLFVKLFCTKFWLTEIAIRSPVDRFAAVAVLTILCYPTFAGATPGRLQTFLTANVDSIDADANLDQTKLVSVTMDDTRGVIPESQLIDINLVHYVVTTATSGSTQAVLNPNSDQSPRAPLIDVDDLLNTGLFNVPLGSGIVQGQSPLATLNGIGIEFAHPVINGPGDDIVFFDFRSLTDPDGGDPFIISGLVGGASVGFATVTTLSTVTPVVSAGYSDTIIWQSILGTNIYRVSNPLDDVTDLDGNSLGTPTTTIPSTAPFGPPRAIAGSFDLSALGIPLNSGVEGLFIQSSNAARPLDLVYLAGLNPVPEPGSGVLILLGLLTIARHRHCVSASLRRRIG